MTNERAVEILNLDLDILGQYGDETAEVYKMAIQALEQQPTDAVSRSELQKTMDSLPLFRFVNNDHEEADDYYNCESVDMVIRNLPSVTPRRDLAETSQDCISREYIEPIVEELENICINGDEHILSLLSNIKNAPSVTPQRPKGKWIKIEYDVCTIIYKCSKCGMRVVNPYKYCPNCGAEMSGGGEDEVSN